MKSIKKSINERAQHKQQYDRRVNKRLMQTQESKVILGKVMDADLVVMESNGTEFGKQDMLDSVAFGSVILVLERCFVFLVVTFLDVLG
ncbi:hypothetical protein Tco_0959748 [Tanacetum coccineum]